MITIEGWIYGQKDWDGTYWYTFFSGSGFDMPSYFKVCPFVINAELPANHDNYSAQLETLKANKQRVLAENEMREQKAEEFIQQHLAIENKMEAA